MKKKLMMVAVLIGALSLGACVDNKESDSVVAVRTAKAAQLNSIAAMNNAEAEVKKAMAAYQQALADAENMKNEVSKATLETDIAAAKVAAEAALERAKADLEAAKAQLIASLDKVDIATKERITTLLGKANLLLNNNILPDRQNLIDAKNTLALFKAELITAAVVNQKALITQEKTKATAQALIAEYEKYSQEDKANAEKAANEADAKVVALDKIDNEKHAAYLVASQAYSDVNVKRGGSVYFETLMNVGYYKSETVQGKQIIYTNDDATSGSVWTYSYQKYTPELDRFNEEITNYTRDLSVAKAALVDAEKALADVKATDDYKNLQKAVTDAQKKFDEATTEADKNTARNELVTAENDLRNATISEEAAVENANIRIKNAESNLKQWNNNLASVSGDNAAAYNTLTDELVKAIDKLAEAEIASGKSFHNWSVQGTLASTLRGIASGLTDYATEILTQKEAIAKADEEIAKLNTMSEEQTIANQEATIARLENNLSVNEPIYKSYLEQIKALVGGTAE